MQLPAQFLTLLATFASSPDLCADVYLDEIGAPIEDSIGQTLPRYCQWAGPNAAELDAEVCCTIDDDGAHCSLPGPNGRCALGFKMYCAFGDTGGGGVTCLQPYPSACDNASLRPARVRSSTSRAARGEPAVANAWPAGTRDKKQASPTRSPSAGALDPPTSPPVGVFPRVPDIIATFDKAVVSVHSVAVIGST